MGEIEDIRVAVREEIEAHEKSLLREKSVETLHMYLFEVVKDQPVQIAKMFLEVLLVYAATHIITSIVSLLAVACIAISCIELKSHFRRILDHILDSIGNIINIDWRMK
jgi:hypothetical protein